MATTATMNPVIIDLCWHKIADSSRLAKKHERTHFYVFQYDENETLCPFSKGILYVGFLLLSHYFMICTTQVYVPSSRACRVYTQQASISEANPFVLACSICLGDCTVVDK